jgi:hypothetical protein
MKGSLPTSKVVVVVQYSKHNPYIGLGQPRQCREKKRKGLGGTNSDSQAGRGVTTAVVFLIITFLTMEEPSKVEAVTEPHPVFEARATLALFGEIAASYSES